MSDNKPEEQRDKTLGEIAFTRRQAYRGDSLRWNQIHPDVKSAEEAGAQAVADESVRRNDSKWWKLYCNVKAKQMLSDNKQAELIETLIVALKTCETKERPDYDHGGVIYDYDFDAEMVKEALRKAEGVSS